MYSLCKTCQVFCFSRKLIFKDVLIFYWKTDTYASIRKIIKAWLWTHDLFPHLLARELQFTISEQLTRLHAFTRPHLFIIFHCALLTGCSIHRERLSHPSTLKRDNNSLCCMLEKCAVPHIVGSDNVWACAVWNRIKLQIKTLVGKCDSLPLRSCKSALMS